MNSDVDYSPTSLVEEVEQLRVQLAGCGVAAIGATNPDEVAKKGDYGWSVAYEDVLSLRRERDTLFREHARVRGLLKAVHDWFMQQAPDRYAGCGLCLDVAEELRDITLAGTD